MPSRRRFLRGTGTGLAGAVLASGTPQNEKLLWTPVEAPPTNVTRTWLGPSFWANRLQDWRLHEGRLECLTGAPGDEVRAVALLTREMVKGARPAHIQVRTGAIESGPGFRGFLIGAGGGLLDYRAAALVHKSSGVGGGILCVYESDGIVRFREHTSEEQPLRFAELEGERSGKSSYRDEAILQLNITPTGAGRFDLEMTASDAASAVLRNVAEADILGGISLVSSPMPGRAGARYWFGNQETAGAKIALHPERSIGPILGAMYSLNGKVLKLSAQLTPIGESEPQNVKLEYRVKGGAWKNGATARLSPGFVAQFRLEPWDASREWEYRVVYGGQQYAGIIRKDPVDASTVSIALFSCTLSTARSIDGGVFKPQIPGEQFLGRYTTKALYYPHSQLVRNVSRHQAHLNVFCGDQFYENNPTRKDPSEAPTLDYLYKWYLWVLSFRDLTRGTPSIVMVDDHDVFHGNIWGHGGRRAPERVQNLGGYMCTSEFVNIVQGTQCGHNPDAFDPTPVEQGITVYYSSFRFGGISFAVLEDRKFKTAPPKGNESPHAVLLGERQEKFLETWARERDGAIAKICLTQTAFACVQTDPQGAPRRDFDSNGYPKPGRDRAIRLLRDAKALLLAGDQHLASVVRHGIDTFTDGVVQFSGPGGGTSFQRWFEPAAPSPNGNFTDGFGNKFRVLAVANPKVSFNDYRKYKGPTGQGLGDRSLKSEGYGIVHVDRKAREFVLECWSWDVDPKAAGAKQFPGWPVRVKFGE
ncbi:MAG: alkaline phosphatase D family protein [Bryobacteraceae bacterium]